ncbi:MAG: ComF family protein [Hydrogenoanaerobacterium sp.]
MSSDKKDRGFISALLKLIYPPCCASCGKLLQTDEDELCLLCAKTLLLRENPRCQCGGELEGVFAAFAYSGTGAELMKKFKFCRSTDAYEAALRRPFEACIKFACCGLGIDVVVPVPLYISDKHKRGFNQSEYIAQRLAKHLCLPCDADILQKTQKNETQHFLPREKRLENVKDVYACKNPKIAAEKTILLVDDITTTGATIAECARVLHKAGAKTVYAAVVLETPNNHTKKYVET